MRTRVDAGTTYWSAATGPYLWHEFDVQRVTTELRAMSAFGVRVVRTLLPWDVFMPQRDAVPAARLRDVETLLSVAAAQSISVVPVLFAHSLGDCVMLPAYAIDVRTPRAGVRVLTDAVVQPGGPRDMYTDTLMLDTAVAWLASMLGAFAGHPAIAAWDLGHDPASTVRPRRIDDMRRWVTLLAGRVHERAERCVLTLSTRDLVNGRAVRMNALAPALDGVGLILEPEWLAAGHGLDAHAAVFLLQLANTFAPDATPLTAHLAAAEDDDAAPANRYARDTVAGVIENGAAAVFAGAWASSGARVAHVPPLDHAPALGRRGLVDSGGDATVFGAAWREQFAREHERHARVQLATRVDVDDYYANLPDSVNELYAAWEDGGRDDPAMLS